MPDKTVHTVKTIICQGCGNTWRICDKCFNKFGEECDHHGGQVPRTGENATVNFCSKCSD